MIPTLFMGATTLMALTIQSPVFSESGSIPPQYTCEGKDISPPLSWSSLPLGTKSLALVVDDPDAPDPENPKMTYVHWILYNLPITANGLAEALSHNQLPTGTLQGKNDWGRVGYGGPCPPIGRHRYFFKLYALDIVLPDLKEPNQSKLQQAMEGHILEKAELVGTYRKTNGA